MRHANSWEDSRVRVKYERLGKEGTYVTADSAFLASSSYASKEQDQLYNIK